MDYQKVDESQGRMEEDILPHTYKLGTGQKYDDCKEKGPIL